LKEDKLSEERLPERGYRIPNTANENITVSVPIKDHNLFKDIVHKFGWACM